MLGEMIYNNENETRLKEIIKKVGEDNLKLAREKEHFDICIYHNDGNKIVYDIIIENKVKSIPYKTQLDGYVKKIQDKQDEKAIYILLTLVKVFAQKDNIKDWNVVHYDSLSERIDKNYLRKCFKTKTDRYIKDYCRYLSYLNKLGLEEILKNDSQEILSQTYTLLKGIRLHDLYVKLTGSIFIGNLYTEIIKCQKNESLITFGKEDRDDTEHHIFLSSSYNNGKCTITAAIRKDNIFYIIQIEGNPFDGNNRNQYRHMVNKINLAKDNIKKINKKRTEIDPIQLEKELAGIQQALDFIKFIKPFEVKGASGPISNYCKYEPHVVYRYKTFNDSYFDKMLKVMAEDVIYTYKQLNIN